MLNNNDTFWIELIETTNQLEKLSTKIDGKHYVGFLDWREKKEPDGTVRKWKSANMRVCNWEKCQTCNPQIEEKEIF
ncbi:hypothetical protein [endosymbiont GvMRE of Glomus versiforme]|uniref:hypothetical protein n=1 Tax=endosymbiont GvMRE of Glomus versiforme TaxID=2039283 RepID=UPI000EEEC338|nr:hypothetical protein [endosymbiont GvMRE of Glomus versiforme]RHZ36112.1 hypothetical protein GvMRE_Ic2g45 [endosymbiont GvMRE of Glomus versiforme]